MKAIFLIREGNQEFYEQNLFTIPTYQVVGIFPIQYWGGSAVIGLLDTYCAPRTHPFSIWYLLKGRVKAEDVIR